MDIKIIGHKYEYDITSMAMLFFPGEKVNYTAKPESDLRCISYLKTVNGLVISFAKLFYNNKKFVSFDIEKNGCDLKNLVKQSFYKACSKATGIKSPWGILTGIRPLSVYVRHMQRGDDPESILKDAYYLSQNKIDVLTQIYNAEKTVLQSKNSKDVSFYVSIPFCPSKCNYCSFVSVAATNSKLDLLSEYINNLCLEIKDKAMVIKNLGLNVKTVYIGGGTPGILSEKELENLLTVLNNEFSFKTLEEVCFEMGRPETVTEGKLEILKRFNVSRICINTQSTNNAVLNSIGRRHTAEQYKVAVKKAFDYNFSSINTDLIAGLTGEGFDSFCNSLNDVIDIGVDNITIHTLAIKKSSNLSEDMTNYTPINRSVSQMIEYAYKKLSESGYIPYYIYRQKNCVSNGENVGFCKADKLCRYNVYMMEDVHSVIACGAGASTKIVCGSKVDRVINVKYPMEYINEYYKIENNTHKTEQLLKAVFENEQSTN